MIEYYILLILSIGFGIWLKIRKRQLNIKYLVLTNVILLIIVTIQLNFGRNFSLRGYHDLIFFILFQCSGILLFFCVFQNKRDYILKIYGTLLLIMAVPTSVIILLDERPKVTRVADNIEIRRINGKILTCGHMFSAAVPKWLVLEKNISMDIGSCEYEKSKKVEVLGNKLILTVMTTDGAQLQSSAIIH